MITAEGCDWDAMMRLGLGRLGLSPDAFWAMTPLEFQRALEGAGLVAVPGSAIDRAALDALIARFPDGGPASAGVEGDHENG